MHTSVPLGPLGGPRGWWMRVAHQEPTRLVVFVHGYRGKPTPSTWGQFMFDVDERDPWWTAADMLFVGYRVQDNPQSVAELLLRQLDKFYPFPRSELLTIFDASPRSSAGKYDELVIVGHSLGGLIVRRALLKAAQELLEWNAQRNALEARVRLFSPASGGFRPAGILGAIRASAGWKYIEPFLRRDSSYSDLQPGSSLITSTRELTEDYIARLPESERGALRPHILWADKENVVVRETYRTDPPDRTAWQRDHSNVCKPDATYTDPWVFASIGNQP